MKSGPTLVFLVTEDYYFLSHRLPMALAAQRAGYDVHVATRVGSRGEEIAAHGFKLHSLDWKRGSTNPRHLWSIVRQVRALYRSLKPDLVHHVALQPAVIGSVAAAGLPMKRLNAFAGLGFAFTSRSPKARIMRPILTALLRWLMGAPGASALVQNPDDRRALEAIGVAPDRITLIPGSGVDADKLRPLPEPDGIVTAAFAGRLLDDKGIRALVAAHELMRARGKTIRLLIAGDRDPANPASIPPKEVQRWKGLPDVEVLGHVNDINAIWARAHVAVLPSRREGLPKSLLEAAACGRPIVATDVPGCREIARHEVNALLVAVDAPDPLAGALTLLADDRTLRERFGAAGRKMVEDEFSSARVGIQIVALYDRLLGRGSGLLPEPVATS
ncbi:glycosyltransferase family 4 protein [Pseudorhodoplanes sp.]|uniref:glycosyltransferase family 4 protein n=1 Tax=Pseudorhodoplanes sp. TaxID=1934341 RepID=UPI002C629973|nr:glycosyltransferase family 4 protein [Pseudorhodoplanes sp.]HWV40177.1 glycosyltransferase family 4 protein [Pseudorhodoplanes sp.]